MSAADWRIEVDSASCDGHGICALILPERIALDGWGFALVDPEPLEPWSLLARARRAVAACPKGALALRPRP